MQVDFNVKDLVYTGALLGLGYFLKKTDKKLENVDRNSFRAFTDFRRQVNKELDDITREIIALKKPKEVKA